MGDQGGRLRGAPDQSHPEETEPEGNKGTPPEGRFEATMGGRVGNRRVLKIFISLGLVLGDAETIVAVVLAGAS